MNSKTVSLMSVILAAVLPVVAAQGAVVRYVALDGSDQDGQSWATAYKTIQGAINDSQMAGGAEIHVKTGTYAVTQAITVTKAVRIYGGYSGVDDTRDAKAYATSVNGGGKAGHCFKVTANATLDGFTITGGAGAGTDPNGGGVSIVSCAPTISNCQFTLNSSTGCGGALVTSGGTGTRISDCTFTQNAAGLAGGAIHNENGSAIQITDCNFIANAAGADAGAVDNVQTGVTITGCLFQENRASEATVGAGGGVVNDTSPAVITNCTFYANRAPYGGAVFNYNSSPTIFGCLFSTCDPNAISGGGVYNNGGAPTIKSCLFEWNTVTTEGGGLLSAGAAGKVINCVFWRNYAGFGGGGICVMGAAYGKTIVNPQFINCTIYGNAAGTSGGGVYDSNVPMTLLNSIVWDNYAGDGTSGVYNETGSATVQYSDVQGSAKLYGTGNVLGDPGLGDPNNYDFGIAFDSVCVDAGSNTAIAGVTLDYEDQPRVFDGNADGKAVVDIGAVELQGQPHHLTQGEIMQTTVYDSASSTTPSYVFLLRLTTDDGLSSVGFQAPGGSATYTIPSDASKISGTVETYHTVQGKVHTWEYWDTRSDPSALAIYGNGTYRITANYRNNTQSQTQIAYYVPNTTTPIPQPTQKPQMTAPADGNTVPSPVTFKWNACTDPAVNAVRLTIIDANSNDVADAILAGTATQSDAYTLNGTSYMAELAFCNYYDKVASSDGTPFHLGRATLVGCTFKVSYTAVYRFWAASNDANFYTISGADKQKVLTNWPTYWTYKGVAFNAWGTQSNDNLLPVYRFWSNALSSHFYTISEDERSKILTLWPGFWQAEGIAFYAYPDGLQPTDSKPVYRFYNTSTGTHYFTIDENEMVTLSTEQSYVYTYEGIAFYAYPP